MKLAIHGGTKSIVGKEKEDLFHWPIVTNEDIDAVVAVMKAGTMSGTAITKDFEKKFSEYLGAKYSLGFCNGTASLLAAMWACGVGAGDEIICPSMTYWASAAPALMLGATVNFCDIDPHTLCLDSHDLAKRINSRTKAIVVVHYAGYPAPMDEIMAIAKQHGVKVIEDNSHAQGSLYKGQFTGTIGDIGAMSLMAGKGFAVGEAGIIVTDDRELYERCIAFAHYERTGAPSKFNPVDSQLTNPALKRFAGIPLGAMKGRMNQTCSAMGLVQLTHYPSRIQEIQDSMHYFWDLLEGVPGIYPHKTVEPNSSMGCWYYPQGLFRKEELHGIDTETFTKAIQAEGIGWCFPGGNSPLHLHPYFHESDVFHMGKPTAIAFNQKDVRQKEGTLPVSEQIHEISIAVPWFKHVDKPEIQKYANAFKKVAEYYSTH